VLQCNIISSDYSQLRKGSFCVQGRLVLIDAAMEPERITRAIDACAPDANGSAARADAAHADLQQRHQRLREDAASALEELDQLLLALDR
jgi:hypothetical protein